MYCTCEVDKEYGLNYHSLERFYTLSLIIQSISIHTKHRSQSLVALQLHIVQLQ
jgi:hypothetical protein